MGDAVALAADAPLPRGLQLHAHLDTVIPEGSRKNEGVAFCGEQPVFTRSGIKGRVGMPYGVEVSVELGV